MYVLGVDIGTTFTAAAIVRDDHAEVVTLGDRSATIPSAVLLREDGTMLTGDAALRRGIAEPSRLAREFKRRFGDTTPLFLGGHPVLPEALTGRLLREVVDSVTDREGAAPSAICLTHPANWGPYKRDLLTRAAALAGVRCPVTLITEPEAAATFYADERRPAPGAPIAVYDLGGGTFDVSTLRARSDGFDLLGVPDGIDLFGGIDIDAAVFDHVTEALGEQFTQLDPDDPATSTAVARLRAECVDAKEALSADTDVSIPVLLPTVSTQVRLTRAELETMARPMLRGTLGTLRRAVELAGVTTDSLHAVLLVGGASRMPLVAEMIEADLGRPVAVDAHPKFAVCLGAARVADASSRSETVRTPVRAVARSGAESSGAGSSGAESSAETTVNLLIRRSPSDPLSRISPPGALTRISQPDALTRISPPGALTRISQPDALSRILPPGAPDATMPIGRVPLRSPAPASDVHRSPVADRIDDSGPESVRPAPSRSRWYRRPTGERGPAGTHRNRVVAAAAILLALVGVAATAGWLKPDDRSVTAAPDGSDDVRSALVELRAIADRDRSAVTSGLWAGWVPQISQVSGDDYPAILAEYRGLVTRIPDALLVATDDYPHVFATRGSYATLASRAFLSSDQVFGWCTDHQFDATCVALLLTDSGAPVDNTVLPPAAGGAAGDPSAVVVSSRSPRPTPGGSNPTDVGSIPPRTTRPSAPGGGGGPGPTQPGTGNPGTTDPGTTDPGTTDPGTTDPGTTVPGTTDPGTTDPGTTDPGTTDPGTTDPGTTDPGTTDPGTTDPPPAEPGPSNPPANDPPAADPPPVDPAASGGQLPPGGAGEVVPGLVRVADPAA